MMSDNSPQFVFADTVERRNAMRVSKMDEDILVNPVEDVTIRREFESYAPEEKKGWPKPDKVIKNTSSSS